jgi:tRNA threonylcarbamoyladenosine biosynthesis protein TsaE
MTKALDKTTVSKSLEDTKNIATSFLQNLKPANKGATVVCLSGDLGAGKTAFIKELGALLGIRKEEITSPTFVIEKIYGIAHKDFHHLIHIDAYRIEESHELVTLGWNEIVEDKKNLICIEWPDKIKDILPKETCNIEFEFIDESTRNISFPKALSSQLQASK